MGIFDRRKQLQNGEQNAFPLPANRKDTQYAGTSAVQPSSFSAYPPKDDMSGAPFVRENTENAGMPGTSGALFDAKLTETSMKQPIEKEQLHEAMDTLRRYKAGKTNLDRRIIENEQWWKLRHWDFMKEQGTTALQTKSGWLVNVILSKHADAMDAYPSANFLPRAADDKQEAQNLSDIVPVIMEQCQFEQVWADNWWNKLQSGCAVYGVYWDKNKLNGLGDITIRAVDLLNLYWEPGVRDIQASRNLFHVELMDNAALEDAYPQLQGKLGGKNITPAQYLYDDSVDTSDKSPVIDWYYKRTEGGKTVLHYCKFVGETVLYSTENNADGLSGLYDHGRYPFVFDTLFPEKGTPTGYGYIDLCKDAQRQIDLINNAIVANCLAVATPRWFVRGDGGINEEEFLDWTKPFVHVQGSLDDQAVKSIQGAFLNSNYLAILNSKIAEMKETSGNRDVNNGGAPAGVTAASAIASMQEQSGKLSRDQIQASYRSYRQICYFVIELIRQFYTAPRQFRITGKAGSMDFVSYDNGGLQDVQQGVEYGQDMGMRSPVFDIDVRSQRKPSYTTLSQNELVLQLHQAGLLAPQNASVSIPILEAMDFEGKDEIIAKLQNLGQQYDAFMQFQQMMMAQRGIAPGAAQMPGGRAPAAGDVDMERVENAEHIDGNRNVEKAKAQAQEANLPR